MGWPQLYNKDKQVIQVIQVSKLKILLSVELPYAANNK